MELIMNPAQKLILIAFIFCSMTPSGCATDDNCPNTCSVTGRPRYVVVTHPKGHGFANRIRAMASAHTLSVLTGRTLIIDWQVSPNETPAEFNQIFKNKILTLNDMVLPEGIKPEDLRTIKSDGKFIEKFDLNNKNYETTDNGSACSCADIVWIESWYRFKQAGKTFEDIRPIYIEFLRQLKPVDEISKPVNDFFEQHFKGSVIGVHFRSFTLSADGHIKARSTTEERENAMIDAMRQEIAKNDKIKFFVATDRLQSLIRMKNEFGGERILSREKQADRTTIAGMIDGVIDWYLLGKTEFVMGSLESSFSEEAALLTTRGKKIEIGPAFF